MGTVWEPFGQVSVNPTRPVAKKHPVVGRVLIPQSESECIEVRLGMPIYGGIVPYGWARPAG